MKQETKGKASSAKNLSSEFARGGQLIDAFQYMHHARRDPRLNEGQRAAAVERYEGLRAVVMGLAHSSALSVHVRDSARAILYAAKADDDAFQFMPSLVGYSRDADARAAPAREVSIKEQGLDKKIAGEARRLVEQSNVGKGRGDSLPLTYDHARAQAIESHFKHSIKPDIDHAIEGGVAFTKRGGVNMLGFGTPKPERHRPQVNQHLSALPIAGNDVYDGLDAVQILNPNNPVNRDKSGVYLNITDSRTGNPRRVNVPGHLQAISAEQGRSFTEAIKGRDPYSMQVARFGLSGQVVGKLLLAGSNKLSKVPVIGPALHHVGLDYKKGEDYEVPSLQGTMAFVPKITGDIARDRRALLDPVALRMIQDGDEKSTLMSGILGGAVGVADFVATQYALKRVLALAGPALKIGGNMLTRAPLGPGKMLSVYGRWGADVSKRLASMGSVSPARVRGGALAGMQFGTARNLAQEISYGGIAGILDINSNFWNGVGNGAHEWAIESVLSPIGKRLWRGVGRANPSQLITYTGTKIASMLPAIRKMDLGYMSPAVTERVLRLDATRGGLVADDIRRGSGNLPSSNVELRAMLSKRYKSAEINQEIMSALDIMFVGSAAHAHMVALEAANEGSEGYFTAFKDAMASKDALAAGLGMVAGGLGTHGISRILGGQRKLRRETGTGQVEELTTNEAINQASYYLWEQMTSPNAKPHQLRFLSAVGATVAKEVTKNPGAGRRSTSSTLYKITSADRADGMETDLADFMELQKLDAPWQVNYKEFLDWRTAQGKQNVRGGRPVELGAGRYVDWLNDLQGVDRKQAGYLYSAGERLALLHGQSGTPGSRSLGSVNQAVKNAKTFELEGLARDLMRLPQRVTDLLPGEGGATQRQVRNTLALVIRTLKERMVPPTGPPGSPGTGGAPKSPPGAGGPSSGPRPKPRVPKVFPGVPPLTTPVTILPAGATPLQYVRVKTTAGGHTWVDVDILGSEFTETPPTQVLALLMQRYGIDVREASRLAIHTAGTMLTPSGELRSGPMKPGTSEALRARIIERGEDVNEPAGLPPEFEEGVARAVERLSEPGLLNESDLTDAAAADASSILQGRGTGTVDRDRVLADVAPLIEQLENGDTSQIEEAQDILPNLRALQESVATEIVATQSEAVDAEALSELIDQGERLETSIDVLTRAIEAVPEAQATQAEGSQIAQLLEIIREAEEVGAVARTMEERLAPELSVLGLSLDEARIQADRGTLQGPEWFQRLLAGDENVLTQEEALAGGRELLEPFFNRPRWMLDPDNAAAETLDRFVGRPESLSPSRLADAIEAAKAEALSRQLAMPFGGESTDQAMLEELSDAAIEATLQGDQELAVRLHKAASFAEATQDAEPISRVDQTRDLPDAPHFQGDLFTPGDQAAAANFDMGQRLIGSATGDDISGWRSALGLLLSPGRTEELRVALDNGAVYASGGTRAALEFIDALHGTRERTSSANKWKEMANLGLARNGDAIRAALTRIQDAHGVTVTLESLPPLTQESLQVLSLGARLLSPVSGETKVDTKIQAAISDVLHSEKNNGPAGRLDRARRVILEGFPGVRRKAPGSAEVVAGKRSGPILPLNSSESDINQAAQGLVEIFERLEKVISGKTKIKQITPLGQVVLWARKFGGGVGPSKKLGGLTPVQFAAEIVREVSGADSGVTGQRSNRADEASLSNIGSATADQRAIFDAASQLGAKLEGALASGDVEAGRAAIRSMLAVTSSSRQLSLDVAKTLVRINNENGDEQLLFDATEEDDLLRFYMRALSSPGTAQHKRILELASRSGIDPEEMTATVRKAQEVAHNQHVLLRFIFSTKNNENDGYEIDETPFDPKSEERGSYTETDSQINDSGQDFYEAFVTVMERAASGVEVASVEEVELFNHWSKSLGVELVEVNDGIVSLNEHGVHAARLVLQSKMRFFGKQIESELEGGALEEIQNQDLAYFFSGLDWKMLTILLPKRIQVDIDLLTSSEALRGGLEGTIIALDAMGLGRLVDVARPFIEVTSRRTKGLGKGSNERKQDVAGLVSSQSAKIRASNFVVETAHAMDDYWSSIPAHLRQAAGVLIDTKAWMSIRNAKHLASILKEPLTPKVSQLYDALIDYNFRILEIGRQAVLSGFISRAQFNSFTSGPFNLGREVPRNTPIRTSYLMAALAPTANGHLHNQSINPGSRSQRQGIFATVGREMARNWSGVADNATRIFDPLVGLSSAVSQESNQVAIYTYLQKMATKWGVKFTDIGNRIPKHERRAFMTAAVPLGYTGDKDLVSGRRILPVQRALSAWVGEIRAAQDRYNSSNGQEGIRPNLLRTRMLEGLVPSDGTPGVALTRHNAFDLKFMLEQYSEGGDYGSAVGKMLDGWYARWRRTRTTSRMAHIFMSQASAFGSSVATGRTTMYDLARGILANRGPYADAADAQAAMAMHMADPNGGHDKHPLFQEYRQFLEAAGTTTMVANLINNHQLFDIKKRLQSIAGVPFNAGPGVSGHIANAEARVTAVSLSTADGIERNLARLLAKNPSETEALVRATELHTAHYQATEMYHKFAAYRSAALRNPSMAQTVDGRLVLYKDAAAGTGDYSEASPHLLEWGSRFRRSPIDVEFSEGNQLVEDAGHVIRKALFTVPFLSYTQVMSPTWGRAMISGKGVGAARVIIATAGMSAALLGVARMFGVGEDDDERAQRASAGTRLYRAASWDRAASDLWRSRNGDLAPMSFGAQDADGAFTRSIQKMASVILGKAGRGDLMVSAAPDFYGRGSSIDATPLLGGSPLEVMVRLASEVGLEGFANKVASGKVLEASGDTLKAMLLSDGVQGWTTQHALGLVAAAKGIFGSAAGATSEDRAIRGIEWVRDQFAAELNPLTAPYSSVSQRFFEATAMRGTPLREWAQGIRRPEGAALSSFQRISGAALGSVLSVREIPDRRARVQPDLTTLESLKLALIGERYNASQDAEGKPFDSRAFEVAGPKSRRALEGVVRGIYEQARNQGALARPINDSLNHELAFLATDVRSTTHAGVSTLDFKQGYQPKGELDRFVMRQQGLERHYSIRVLQQMVSNMGDSRRVATTYLQRAIEMNSIDGALAMRLWDGITHPSPIRILEIIQEDMQDPRNHPALLTVWRGVQADLAGKLDGNSVQGDRARNLYGRLRYQFQQLEGIDEMPAPSLGTRMIDIDPARFLNTRR